MTPARKLEIGQQLLSLYDDLLDEIRALIRQYRNPPNEILPYFVLQQAIDAPHRARTRIQYWIDRYDAKNTPGDAVTLLQECLSLTGATTLQSINDALGTLETQAQTLVDRVQSGWTWDQVADAMEAALDPPAEREDDLILNSLPLPKGYLTVWGEPY